MRMFFFIIIYTLDSIFFFFNKYYQLFTSIFSIVLILCISLSIPASKYLKIIEDAHNDI